MDIIETNLNFNGLTYGNNPNQIILHHAEAKNCSIYDIHQWHKENGWAGCGYHFLVRKDGSIYRGRPTEAIGSHCKGKNSVSIGICAEGDYMIETMPLAQKQAIIELIAWLKKQYGNLSVYGHKEAMNYETSCPGDNFPLQDIKKGTVEVDTVVTEVKKVENLVVYNYGPDQGAAEYLANYLNCPVITNNRKFDFSCVKNLYAVGGRKEQYSSYVKQVIAGTDQYETMKEVLHFCEKLW